MACELITFGRSARLEIDSTGLRHRTLAAVAWLGGHPAHPLAPALPLVIARSHPTWLHTHHMRSLPSQMAVVGARVGGARTAVTDHGLQGTSWGGLLPRLFDRFLTVSAYSAAELHAPAARTRVIYGGADPDRYYPDPGLTRRGVLFVGRLTPHKGVDRLLRALPPGATARLVGTAGHDPRPPERDYPGLLRALAHDRDVEFLGTAHDTDLPRLYRSAEVFVLPSVERTVYGKRVLVSELLGLAALEAMASGTPVIASRLGGLREIVEDGQTGFLVSPDNPAELAARLEQVLGDPALARRLGARAREVVLERFTWAQVAQRCLDAYAEMS